MTKKKSTPPAKQTTPVHTYEFIERDEIEEKQADINYPRLLNIAVEKRSLEDSEEEKSQQVVFYCKQCEGIRSTEKVKGKKLKFYCTECKSNNIYLGTQLGIEKYFHISS